MLCGNTDFARLSRTTSFCPHYKFLPPNFSSAWLPWGEKFDLVCVSRQKQNLIRLCYFFTFIDFLSTACMLWNSIEGSHVEEISITVMLSCHMLSCFLPQSFDCNLRVISLLRRLEIRLYLRKKKYLQEIFEFWGEEPVVNITVSTDGAVDSLLQFSPTISIFFGSEMNSNLHKKKWRHHLWKPRWSQCTHLQVKTPVSLGTIRSTSV